MSDPTDPEDPQQIPQTQGVRCAWCGKIMRRPVGFPPDSEDSLVKAWSHGMCADCRVVYVRHNQLVQDE